MIKTIIYHNTEKEARRVRRPRAGETVAYRSIKDWDEKENEKVDEVIDLSTKTNRKSKGTKQDEKDNDRPTTGSNSDGDK